MLSKMEKATFCGFKRKIEKGKDGVNNKQNHSFIPKFPKKNVVLYRKFPKKNVVLCRKFPKKNV